MEANSEDQKASSKMTNVLKILPKKAGKITSMALLHPNDSSLLQTKSSLLIGKNVEFYIKSD